MIMFAKCSLHSNATQCARVKFDVDIHNVYFQITLQWENTKIIVREKNVPLVYAQPVYLLLFLNVEKFKKVKIKENANFDYKLIWQSSQQGWRILFFING